MGIVGKRPKGHPKGGKEEGGRIFEFSAERKKKNRRQRKGGKMKSLREGGPNAYWEDKKKVRV